MVGGIPLKRILSLVLAAALLLCSGVHAAWAAEPMASNGRPYFIMVNRAQSTVTVYELDEDGYYTVPVKAMICSTGREGHATPAGTYGIGGRWPWLHMIDGSYGQYATQISGNILFHSVCYTERAPSTLMTEEYNGLGAPASLGCVRLQTVDAKWIYDNCARGTKVVIYDNADDPGPLGKPDRAVDYISEEDANGWDPTDPREENPWREILSVGEDPAPEEPAEPEPEESAPEPLETETPAPEEPTPDESEPPSVDQAVSYADAAQALYQLSGEGKLTTPAQMVAWAINNRLWAGMMGRDFRCSAPVTRQDLITMLYRYETRYLRHTLQDCGPLSRFADGEQVQDYAKDAMCWAVEAGLIQSASDNTLHPTQCVSRAQLDIFLGRYSEL